MTDEQPKEVAGYEPQTTTREVDIPDADLKRPKAIVLEEPIRLERESRRFIRKDGVFVKDFERFFDVPVLNEDGSNKRDDSGNVIRRKTMTDEEAKKKVIAELKASGRKIITDDATGRLKAVPGWLVDLHVPGMQKEEQHAETKHTAAVRTKLTEDLLATQAGQIRELQNSVKELTQALKAKGKSKGK
jgi:hypothetical protein